MDEKELESMIDEEIKHIHELLMQNTDADTVAKLAGAMAVVVGLKAATMD